MMVGKSPQQPITNYGLVASVEEYMKKVERLGGSICMPKTEVPTMGYFAVCQDPEGNPFGLWESNPAAA